MSLFNEVNAKSAAAIKHLLAVSNGDPIVALLIAQAAMISLMGVAVTPEKYDEAVKYSCDTIRDGMEQQRLARATPAGEA